MADEDFLPVVVKNEHRAAENAENTVLRIEDGLTSEKIDFPHVGGLALVEVGGDPSNVITVEDGRATEAACGSMLLGIRQALEDEATTLGKGEQSGHGWEKQRRGNYLVVYEK
jgi:hypothetical protein